MAIMPGVKFEPPYVGSYNQGVQGSVLGLALWRLPKHQIVNNLPNNS